jgi:hypothetical protein
LHLNLLDLGPRERDERGGHIPRLFVDCDER